MVQRYDPWRGVDESETGEFVTYLDYASLESENAKLKDELAAAQEAHALDRAPMLRAMAVFDEGADDERWTPGVHVVDALIADHAKLKAQADLDGSHIADLTADNAKLRDLLRGEAAVAEECAKIVEEPSGEYSVGHRRLPYWDGEAKAAEIRARFGEKSARQAPKESDGEES